MDIPENIYIGTDPPKIWQDAADKLSMQYGIFIDVKITYRDVYGSAAKYEFEVGGHTFGSLIELRKALRNKAFW